METKRCPRCGKAMRKKDYGFFHCSCGTSWMEGKGFFSRTINMECTFEESVVNGETVRVPVIRHHQKPYVPGKPVDDVVQIERCSDYVTEPHLRKAGEIVYGGIYYIKKHMTDGYEQFSGRPAVVVSDVSEGDFANIVTVVYLTSKDKRFSRTRTLITSSGIVATLLAEQISTVDTRKVGDFLGMCTPEEMTAVKKCMCSHLGLGYLLNASAESAAEDQSDYIRHLEAQVKALQSQLREEQAIVHDLNRKLKR